MPIGSLVYDETGLKPKGGFVQYDRVNATAGYLRHFENLCYLEFIAGNGLATWQERQQAEKEIVLAKRKMQYHQNHPNFNQSEVETKLIAIKSKWAQTGTKSKP